MASGVDEGPVVRLVDSPAPRPASEVVAQIVAGNRASAFGGVARLNTCDVAIVQHEYGVYGGRDGDEVLTVLDAVTVPSIVVLHTVLSAPTRHQREVLEAVVETADAVVTMTPTARTRLDRAYAVDMSKVHLIAHGASDMAAPTTMATFRSGQFTALTWGLLGPGKGIEWAIEAVAQLGDLPRAMRYVIAGRTHPKVADRDGDAYLDGLRAQVRRLGLQTSVEFDSHYRDAASLAQLVRRADVVLLPYDSTEQVTSGVLIEAVAAGKPVIATRFPHARELLSDGAGLLVDHRDAAAIADALRALVTRRDLAATMAQAAAAVAPGLMWPAVAQSYRALAARLIDAAVAA